MKMCGKLGTSIQIAHNVMQDPGGKKTPLGMYTRCVDFVLAVMRSSNNRNLNLNEVVKIIEFLFGMRIMCECMCEKKTKNGCNLLAADNYCTKARVVC